MTEIKLPPLGPHDHPEPHTMKWSALEIAAIQASATAAVEAAASRHAEELAAYELTVSNLRAQRGEPDQYCITTADGGCISDDPRCIHSRPPQAAPPAHTEAEFTAIWRAVQMNDQQEVRRILKVEKPK